MAPQVDTAEKVRTTVALRVSVWCGVDKDGVMVRAIAVLHTWRWCIGVIKQNVARAVVRRVSLADHAAPRPLCAPYTPDSARHHQLRNTYKKGPLYQVPLNATLRVEFTLWLRSFDCMVHAP